MADSAARLLRSGDRLRYVPQAGQTGFATITYRAWDQTANAVGQVVDLSARRCNRRHDCVQCEQRYGDVDAGLIVRHALRSEDSAAS